MSTGYKFEDGHFWHRILCCTCGAEFDVPVYCGDRFCTICGRRRRSRVRSRLAFLMQNVTTKRDHRFKFLTLTIRSQKNPGDMAQKITAAFRRLRNRSFWKKAVAGGAFVIEVTGKHDFWHVHIHAVLYSKFLDWHVLRKNWQAVSGGIGVYIQNIPKAQCIGYLTKYLTKPDIPDEAYEHVSSAMRGLRLFQPFGEWFHLNAKYVKPKPACKNCSDDNFILYDLEITDRILNYAALHT